MARIREAVPMPIAIDQGCFTDYEALRVIQQRAADVMGETGITTLASLQVLATIQNQTDGHQVMHQLLESDIVAPGLLDFQEGHLAVPDRPGLGVELNEDKVEEYARRFEEKGPYHNIV